MLVAAIAIVVDKFEKCYIYIVVTNESGSFNIESIGNIPIKIEI